MNSILCNTHATTIFIAYHISNSRKTTQGGQIFSRQNRFQFFHHHFSKKLRQISKKPKRSCIVWCSCEFISKHEIFLSMKKTVKKLFLASFLTTGFSQCVFEKCIKKRYKTSNIALWGYFS